MDDVDILVEGREAQHRALMLLRVTEPDFVQEEEAKLSIFESVLRKTETDKPQPVWFVFMRSKKGAWTFANSHDPKWSYEDAVAEAERILLFQVKKRMQERDEDEAKRKIPAPADYEYLLDTGIAMTKDTFDWEGRDKKAPANITDVWERVTGPGLDESCWEFPLALVELGRIKLEEEESLRVMYRFFYYSQPISVDFSDMYKTSLCGIVARDYRCAVVLELWKFEPVLTFYVVPEVLKVEALEGELSIKYFGPVETLEEVFEGCVDTTVMKWLTFVHAAVTTRTMIYGNNDFEV
jgi:hypothetical protein